MNKTTACPSPARLRTLLEGELPEIEAAELAEHLDQCEACRDRLVQLEHEYALAVESSPDSADMSRARQSLQENPPLGAGSGWQSAAGAAWEPPPAADSAATMPSLAAELPSGYLQPADDPQLLGRIGHYEILERIGNGGMGVVLKGRDPRLNRMVAIKVLAPHLAASGAARQRFSREARAAALVAHENVVTIHAVEDASGLPLLVMQYVPGISLREKIDSEGPLDVRRIVRIALQTASGLAAAHAQGVIHRDIKPGNILLENGIEKVRLTDFGLATVSDDVALTQTGCLAGTPQYMSPEQIQGGATDARSDLFSLGSVMYEMCTGRPAFRGSNPYAVLHRVCQEMPRPIAEVNPDVPDWLAAIVQRLLQKNPAARFQSAGELVDVLRERLIQLQQPGSQRPGSVPTRLPQTSEWRSVSTAPTAIGTTIGAPLGGNPTGALAPPAVLLAMVGLLMGLCGLLAFLTFGLHGFDGVTLVAVVCSVVGGLPMLVCSFLLLQRRSYAAAMAGAVLAMIPVTPLVLLTLPLGLWALVILLRPEVKAAFDRQPAALEPAAPGKPPPKPHPDLPPGLQSSALGLQVAAIVQIVAGSTMLVLLMGSSLLGFSELALSSIGAFLLGAPVALLVSGMGVWQLIAASAASRQGSIGQLRVAAFLAALPLSPAWLMGLPMAIWAWISLHRHWSGHEPRGWSAPLHFLSAGTVITVLVLAVVGGAALSFAIYAGLDSSNESYEAKGVGVRPIDHLQEVTRLLAAPRRPEQLLESFPLGPPPLGDIDIERQATGAVAFAPDGNLVAFGDSDGFVRVHFVNSRGQAMTPLIQSKEPIRRVAFSPDGMRLAAARELAIDVWDLNKKSLLYSIEPAEEGQSAGGQRVLRFLDQTRLLCDRGKDLVLFDGQTAAGTMSHPAPLAVGDVASEGKFAATGDELGLVKIWNLTDRTLHKEFEAGKQPAQVQFLTDSLLAIACGRQMSVCNLEGERLAEISIPADAWAEDVPGWLATCQGELLARVGIKPSGERKHASVVLWRWDDPALAASFEGVADEPLGLAMDETNQRMAIVTQNRVHLFGLWDVRKAQPAVGDPSQAAVLHPGLEPQFTCVSVTADGRSAVTGQVDGGVAAWDLAAERRLAHWQMSQAMVNDVQFGPTDDYVLAGDEGGNVQLWTRRGEKVWSSTVNYFLAHDQTWGVAGVGFNPPYVLYGYQSRKSKAVAGLHAVRPDTKSAVWMGSDNEIACNDVKVASDGTAWMIDDRGLHRERLLRLSDGSVKSEHSRRWAGTDYLGTVAVTGTGYPIVGTSLPGFLSAKERHERQNDACVRLIEPEEGRVLRVFPTGPGEVTALAASEFRLIAAARKSPKGDANDVIVWDALLGSELVRWSLAGEVRGLAFVPSGRGGQPSKLLVAGERLELLPLPKLNGEK
jgi:serine/threonine protein kinase/WD40 repeat protein